MPRHGGHGHRHGGVRGGNHGVRHGFGVGSRSTHHHHHTHGGGHHGPTAEDVAGLLMMSAPTPANVARLPVHSTGCGANVAAVYPQLLEGYITPVAFQQTLDGLNMVMTAENRLLFIPLGLVFFGIMLIVVGFATQPEDQFGPPTASIVGFLCLPAAMLTAVIVTHVAKNRVRKNTTEYLGRVNAAITASGVRAEWSVHQMGSYMWFDVTVGENPLAAAAHGLVGALMQAQGQMAASMVGPDLEGQQLLSQQQQQQQQQQEQHQQEELPPVKGVAMPSAPVQPSAPAGYYSAPAERPQQYQQPEPEQPPPPYTSNATPKYTE